MKIRLPKPVLRVLALLACSILLALCKSRGVSSRNLQSEAQNLLPGAPGAEFVKQSCLACHEADLIIQQRLTYAGWSREVDKMIRWGAEVPSSQKEKMVAYLASHFAPRSKRSASAALVEDDGVEVVRIACTTCHEADLILQQRLTRAGWTREAEKMIRWGAEVRENEKEKLIDYLARNYPREEK